MAKDKFPQQLPDKMPEHYLDDILVLTTACIGDWEILEQDTDDWHTLMDELHKIKRRTEKAIKVARRMRR